MVRRQPDPDYRRGILEQESMTKTNREGQKLPWTTPELRRIVAGSAEAVDTKGQADGSKGVIDKS